MAFNAVTALGFLSAFFPRGKKADTISTRRDPDRAEIVLGRRLSAKVPPGGKMAESRSRALEQNSALVPPGGKMAETALLGTLVYIYHVCVAVCVVRTSFIAHLLYDRDYPSMNRSYHAPFKCRRRQGTLQRLCSTPLSLSRTLIRIEVYHCSSSPTL